MTELYMQLSFALLVLFHHYSILYALNWHNFCRCNNIINGGNSANVAKNLLIRRQNFCHPSIMGTNVKLAL